MTFLAGFLAACLAGTAAEYLIHRWAHGWLRRTRLGRFHAEHHRAGVAKPLAVELLTYQPVALALLPAGLAGGWWFLAGWACGGVLYAAAVGAAHWRQHGRGDAFHRAHHKYPRCNYGVITSLWDRVLGTLKRS